MRDTPSEQPGSSAPADDTAVAAGPAEPSAPGHDGARPDQRPDQGLDRGAETGVRKGPEPGSLQGPLQGAAPRWAQEADGAGADGGPEAGETEPGEADELIGAMLSGATYGVLFVLGVFLGLVGALAHAWGFVQVLGWEVPVGALGWLVVLFGVPYAMGRLMETRLGAIVPAVGWGLISAVLAVQRSEGDLIIAANAAGYAYLYGGMLAMAVGVLLVPSQGSWLLTPRLGAPPPGGPQELPR